MEKVKRKHLVSWHRVSNRMCGFKNMFVKLDEFESSHVTFGDASKILVKGKILICLKNGRHQFISNVYYCTT